MLSQVRTRLWRIRHDLVSFLAQYPAVYLPLMRLLIRLWGESWDKAAVTSSTRLVIEGYPRSANTFSLHAFRMAQPHDVGIAHHLHKSAQVTWAAKRGIPTLVLIRRPTDAVLSTMIRQPRLSLHQSFGDYLRFYNGIKPYSSNYVLATFEEVTSDFGEVICRINRRFGTNFVAFEHSAENVNRVFKLVEQAEVREHGHDGVEASETRVARPSGDREAIKERMRDSLKSEHTRGLVAEAERLYEELVGTQDKVS